MKRRAYTIVEAIVALAIAGTLVGLMWPFISGSRAVAKPGVDTAKARAEPPTSWNLYTAQHDGHWFVKDAGGGVCHHPDCPCQPHKAEVER